VFSNFFQRNAIPEASGMANYFAIHAEKTGLLDGPYKTPKKVSK
jgi:hypothetical protein